MSGLVSRLLGRRPTDEKVTAEVTTAIALVPGVIDGEVQYNRLQYSSGALSGYVDLDAAPTFEHVLRAAHQSLRRLLGADADRVVYYLTGRAADGTTVTAEQLGLPQRPTGTDVARRYA
ncbi:hypothetical protein [Nocardioides sp. SR21]|uniref:hypothetical protein n=1 Tax=Nocardioides sp. SR21 TaxID=2919501 RepID=UPI001FA9AF95|nr:hypothetical protein [Nocardioides sp. SR21]